MLRFLDVANVLRIHENTIREEGGMPGIRDYGLLTSAVDMPQASFEGAYLHVDLADKAAAYLYHLCQNHPFADGNKRTAAFSAVLFLYLNGIPVDELPDEDELEAITWRVAQGKASETEAAQFFRALGI